MNTDARDSENFTRFWQSSLVESDSPNFQTGSPCKNRSRQSLALQASLTPSDPSGPTEDTPSLLLSISHRHQFATRAQKQLMWPPAVWPWPSALPAHLPMQYTCLALVVLVALGTKRMPCRAAACQSLDSYGDSAHCADALERLPSLP